MIYLGPLQWWIHKLEAHPNQFPTLGRMALTLFSAPAMSAECERVFSRAKQLITDERSRLRPATIEANELQKDWLRKGLVQSYLPQAERYETRATIAAATEAARAQAKGSEEDQGSSSGSDSEYDSGSNDESDSKGSCDSSSEDISDQDFDINEDA